MGKNWQCVMASTLNTYYTKWGFFPTRVVFLLSQMIEKCPWYQDLAYFSRSLLPGPTPITITMTTCRKMVYVPIPTFAFLRLENGNLAGVRSPPVTIHFNACGASEPYGASVFCCNRCSLEENDRTVIFRVFGIDFWLSFWARTSLIVNFRSGFNLPPFNQDWF